MFLANKLNKGGSLSSPDAQFNYVTMLLHGDGTNGAQNNTFLDSSTNNFTITRNGNTTQGSFSPYGSNWSSYFNSATPDYFTFANSSNFAFGTGNFTIEFWFNASSALNDKMILDFRNGGSSNNLVISTGGYTGSAGSLRYASGSIDITSGSTLICNGLWNHCAVVRSGTTVTLYVNGVSTATGTDSSNFSATSGTNYFGRNSYGSGTEISGYFSNCRIVKGTAVYTSGFTPSTTPLTAVSGTSLLTFQSNRFVDNSGNSVTLTASGTPSVQRFNPFGASTAYSTSVIGGSGYFDGSGDYLETPTSSAFAFGTGNFTSELWVYLSRSNGTIIYEPRTSSNESNPCIAYGVVSANKFEVANSAIIITSSSTFGINQWHHVAIVRSGTTLTLWVNGTNQGSTTLSTNLTNNDRIRIGEYFTAGTYALQGYVSNLRVVKGTAVYTSAFTPSTTPLTAISGTSLLLGMTNGAIFDNAMMNDLETVGNAQISTSVVKYGTGSLAFDGSGDSLVANGVSISGAYNQLTASGVVNTVEFWLYVNSFTSPRAFLCGSWTASGGYAGWGYDVNTNGDIFITANGAGTTVSLSTKITTGNWQHIAFVNDGTNIKIYLNGTNVGTQAVASPSSYIGPLTIGMRSDLNLPLSGYMDEFRITKGYARYTANFSPPTAAFPNTGPV